MRQSKLISIVLCLCMLFSCLSVYSCAAENDGNGENEIVVCKFPDYFNSICGGANTAFTSKEVYDGFDVLKVVPNTDSDGGAINLDGWSWGGARIDVEEYDRLLIVYKYVSTSPVKTKMNLNIMKQHTFSAATSLVSSEDIVCGEWAVAEFDLSSARSKKLDGIMPIIIQTHIYPFGSNKPATLDADDVMYISHLIAVKGEPAEYEFHKSYISGRADSLFGITSITRAEACTVIARLAAGGDGSVPSELKSAFDDVDPGAWYSKYIAYLEDLGYLEAYTGSFEPDKNITRAEFAELVYALGLLDDKGGNDVFTDVPATHERADIIAKAARAGIINGYDNGDETYSFKPDDPIDRAAVVKMISNAYGRACDISSLNSSINDRFTDLAREHWAHDDIIDAAIDHICYRAADGTHKWLYAFGDGIVNEDADIDFSAGESYAANAQALLSRRVDEIRETKSEWSVAEGGKVFYVSLDGDDRNDGLSPESPIKSFSKINVLQKNNTINAGDVVLFRRGDEWRTKFAAKAGVTYSAYGEGAKPILNGNEKGDAADPSLWTLVEGTDNVWKYAYNVLDVGNVVYNDGEKTVEKLVPTIRDGAIYLDHEVFDPKTSMKHNDSFICEYLFPGVDSVNVNEGKARLYVRCDEGNPGEVYDSIELAYRGSLIAGASDTKFDNLCIKYTGSHGIGMGTVKNVTVRNCEICYIGGSAQYYSNGNMTRFGNGVEVYGGCDGYVIDNCYVYQCYDAGITHQYSSGGTDDIVQENVYFTNNVIEKCIYNIEFFMGRADDEATVRKMKNIVYKGNILAYSGTGWGMDPTRSASIKGWDHRNESENFTIESNIFLLDYKNACDFGAYKAEWLPILSGNTYVQAYSNTFTKIGAPTSLQYHFMSNAEQTLKDELGENDAVIYYVKNAE